MSALRTIVAVLAMWAVIFVAAVLVAGHCGGCATTDVALPGGTVIRTTTVLKDVNAQGSIPTPDGPATFAVTSDTNVAAMKAMGEGAAQITGAAVGAAVKGAVKP